MRLESDSGDVDADSHTSGGASDGGSDPDANNVYSEPEVGDHLRTIGEFIHSRNLEDQPQYPHHHIKALRISTLAGCQLCWMLWNQMDASWRAKNVENTDMDLSCSVQIHAAYEGEGVYNLHFYYDKGDSGVDRVEGEEVSEEGEASGEEEDSEEEEASEGDSQQQSEEFDEDIAQAIVLET